MAAPGSLQIDQYIDVVRQTFAQLRRHRFVLDGGGPRNVRHPQDRQGIIVLSDRLLPAFDSPKAFCRNHDDNLYTTKMVFKMNAGAELISQGRRHPKCCICQQDQAQQCASCDAVNRPEQVPGTTLENVVH